MMLAVGSLVVLKVRQKLCSGKKSHSISSSLSSKFICLSIPRLSPSLLASILAVCPATSLYRSYSSHENVSYRHTDPSGGHVTSPGIEWGNTFGSLEFITLLKNISWEQRRACKLRVPRIQGFDRTQAYLRRKCSFDLITRLAGNDENRHKKPFDNS